MEALRHGVAQPQTRAFGTVKRACLQVERKRCAGEKQRVVLLLFHLDLVIDAPSRRRQTSRRQHHVVVLHRDHFRLPAWIGPALAVEFAQRRPAPLHRSHRLRAPNADVHHRPRTGLDLSDVSQVHLVGKAGQENPVRNQPRKGRFGGARQDEKQPRRQYQDAHRDQRGKQAEARVKALRAAAHGDRGTLDRPPDFARSQRRNREQHVQRQEKEKIEIDGKNRRRQQLQKCDDGRIQIVAIALGGQDFHDRQEEQQMDRGRQKIARQQKIVRCKESGVRDGDDGGQPVGEVQPQQPEDQGGA